MSNDTKFLIWRAVMAVLLAIDCLVLFRMMDAVMNPGGHAMAWAFVFFASVAGSVGVGFYYMAAKNKRWESDRTSYPEVEALNTYMQQQAREKRAERNHKD